MHRAAEQPKAPAAVRTDLGAIFVSLELSRSTWLVTSLSPGGGEKMSKHQVRGGDIAALLARFAELKARALARTGKCFPLVVIQEAGLDGPPGTVVFFHCNILHASGHNLSRHDRWAVYYVYNRVANRPADVPNPRPDYVRSTNWAPLPLGSDDILAPEIGRASCRERV